MFNWVLTMIINVVNPKNKSALHDEWVVQAIHKWYCGRKLKALKLYEVYLTGAGYLPSAVPSGNLT